VFRESSATYVPINVVAAPSVICFTRCISAANLSECMTILKIVLFLTLVVWHIGILLLCLTVILIMCLFCNVPRNKSTIHYKI